MRNDGIFYKEETVIFCAVTCQTCGSKEHLMHLEKSRMLESGKIETVNVISCKECFEDLPTINN